MTETERAAAFADLRANPVPTIEPMLAFGLLGLSKNTGYEAIARGDVPAIRAGRRYLIPLPALFSMLGIELEG